MSIDNELDERTDQPLVVMGRDVIIENEILTIHRLMPRTTRRGQGKEFWLAETYVNETLQSIRIWYEEIRLFTDAGYDKTIFDSREPMTVNIQVLPKLKYGKWHIGEVYKKAHDNGVVLLSNAERKQQWSADCADYGSPKVNAITATFYHKDYGAVSWWKNKTGTYTRQGRDSTRMYSEKDPEPIVIVDDEAWIKASMPARYRETLNTMDLAIRNEYEEYIAKEDATALETPYTRKYDDVTETWALWDAMGRAYLRRVYGYGNEHAKAARDEMKHEMAIRQAAIEAQQQRILTVLGMYDKGELR